MVKHRVTAVLKYKSDGGGWKRATVKRAGNGRIKIGLAPINGSVDQVAQIRHEIGYCENRKATYQPMGVSSGSADPEQKVTATDIEAAKLNQERKSSVIAAAHQIGIRAEPHSERIRCVKRPPSTFRMQKTAKRWKPRNRPKMRRTSSADW